MGRLLRFSSGRFERRTDYFYPEARSERLRAAQREIPLSGHGEVQATAEEGTSGVGDQERTGA